MALGLVSVALLAGWSLIVAAGVLLGDGLLVEVALSTGFCVFAVEPLVEYAELEVDELELLLLATLFEGLFIALLAVGACGEDALAVLLLLDASSRGVPASANLVTALSPVASVLAMFAGGEVVDLATLEVGGVVREAVPEGVL